jgi:hypothetical protein
MLITLGNFIVNLNKNSSNFIAMLSHNYSHSPSCITVAFIMLLDVRFYGLLIEGFVLHHYLSCGSGVILAVLRGRFEIDFGSQFNYKDKMIVL